MEGLDIEEHIGIWRKQGGWQVEVGLFSKEASSFVGEVTDEALEAFSASS
ncbi:hypothetical protein [Pseudomonas savastanoi]|nr:hypothetical protein [Pseudomonas savastanoi]